MSTFFPPPFFIHTFTAKPARKKNFLFSSSDERYKVRWGEREKGWRIFHAPAINIHCRSNLRSLCCRLVRWHKFIKQFSLSVQWRRWVSGKQVRERGRWSEKYGKWKLVNENFIMRFAIRSGIQFIDIPRFFLLAVNARESGELFI